MNGVAGTATLKGARNDCRDTRLSHRSIGAHVDKKST